MSSEGELELHSTAPGQLLKISEQELQHLCLRTLTTLQGGEAGGRAQTRANPNDSGGRHSWEPSQAQYWSLFGGYISCCHNAGFGPQVGAMG